MKSQLEAGQPILVYREIERVVKPFMWNFSGIHVVREPYYSQAPSNNHSRSYQDKYYPIDTLNRNQYTSYSSIHALAAIAIEMHADCGCINEHNRRA